ncbi:MAG TPA: chemotaxis protein CheW [Bacillota bacterium]
MAGTDNTLDILNLQLAGGENEEQLVVFNVGDEEFGVNVLNVEEIIRYTKPKKIPHVPRFIEGVIDFRGEVIPVLNMRSRFGIAANSSKEFDVIIVVEYSDRTLGMIVDGVSDILNLPKEKIQSTPSLNAQEKTRYLKAMGKLNDRLILILDLEKIFTIHEEEALDELESSLNKGESKPVAGDQLNSEVE